MKVSASSKAKARLRTRRKQPTRRLRLLLIGGLLFCLVLGGSLGYYLIEGWGFLDSVYMTVITLSTVGFGEVLPLSPNGRAFTILLVIGGVGSAAYAFSNLYNLFLSEESRHIWRTRRRQHMINQLIDHVIVCGYGRMGRQAAANLDREGLEFAVIDRNSEVAAQCEKDGFLAITGNAANAEVLQQAGIKRAKTIIACAASDADNVFIVLTARGLRSDIQIIARANFEDTDEKLMRAGADRVILPYVVAGQRMVSQIVRPAVADFLDVVMHSNELELWLEEFTVQSGAPISGRTLADVNPRQKHGINVLALIPPNGPMHTNPSPDDRIDVGSRLIVLGTRAGLDDFGHHTGTSTAD